MNRANLADGYIEEFSAVLTEKERGIRLEGQFFDLEGLALAHLFKRASHCVDGTQFRSMAKEERWPCVVALDPHPEKKHHAVLLAADQRDNLYILKELNSGSVPSMFATELKKWADGFKVVDWVCDNMGSAKYTGGEGFHSFIEVLNRNGIRIRPTSYQEKQDDDFIERIKEVLSIPPGDSNLGVAREPKLKFANDVGGTIRDIENVEWVKYRDLDMHKPKLNIGNKDFLACVKYALATKLTSFKSRSKIIRAAGPVPWHKR